MARTTKTYDTWVDLTHDVMAAHVNQLGIDVAKIWNTLAFVEATELTLDAAGAVTITQNYHTIDTFGDNATDDLVTLNRGANVEEAFLLIIRPEHTDRTIVVKHGTGNILCVGNADITLDDVHDFVTAIYDETLSKWLVK
ncbi:MAG TPA: hypothetical protein VMW53_07480 [archaeon]|nr:hypothetical protein [archaeon]